MEPVANLPGLFDFSTLVSQGNKYCFHKLDWDKFYETYHHLFQAITLPSEKIYTGECNEIGLPHGKGISWYKAGCPRYLGIWNKGMQHGKGIYFYPSTPGLVYYFGDVRKRQPHGEGMEFNEFGRLTFDGTWEKGIKGKSKEDKLEEFLDIFRSDPDDGHLYRY